MIPSYLAISATSLPASMYWLVVAAMLTLVGVVVLLYSLVNDSGRPRR